MKKLFLVLATVLCCLSGFAQVSISSIEYLGSDKYKVEFTDASNEYLDDHYNTDFVWYLSYKGKRISDYCYSGSRGNRWFAYSWYAWPNEVPVGNEKYVTAQLGKEPSEKDRRDDDYAY